VLEKTPVQSTTQEVFIDGHKRGEARNGVGREMMELSSEKVQETAEKGCAGREKPRSTWVVIRLQRIYNFLLFHAIILPLLDVYGLYFTHLYHFWD